MSLLLLYSCQSSKIADIPQEHIVYPGKNLTSLFDVIDSIKIISLQHNNEIIIGRQPEFWHRDSSFYLVDKYGTGIIFRFGEDGRFINSIGKIGRAPKEYIKLIDVYIEDDKNEIDIISDPVMNMHKYSKEGTYIENKKYDIPITCFCKTGKNYWLYLGYNNYFSNYRFLHADSNMQIIEKKFPFKTNIISPHGYPIFNCYKNHIYVHEYFNSSISEIKNDSIKKLYDFDFGSYNVPESFFNTKDPYKAFENLNQEGFINIIAFHKTDNQCVIEAILQKKNEIKLIYGLQLEKGEPWKWIDYTPNTPSIFMGNIKGFSKNNELVCYIAGESLPTFTEKERKKITNPEILTKNREELDMFLLLCYLKNK